MTTKSLFEYYNIFKTVQLGDFKAFEIKKKDRLRIMRIQREESVFPFSIQTFN